MALKIFLSHAQEDAELTETVRGWLDEQGYDVFVDTRDLHGGDDWAEKLYAQLRSTSVLVCIVTRRSVESRWCAIEIGVARFLGTRIVPIAGELSVTDPELSKLQHIRYAVDPAAARTELLDVLRTIDPMTGWPDDLSPYAGLDPVDTDRHQVFFGREAEVTNLANALRSPAGRGDGSLLLVVGPSGCGKSSLLRAGLVPALRADDELLVLDPIRPNANPTSGLVRVIGEAARRIGREWTDEELEQMLAQPSGLTTTAEELLRIGGRSRRRVVIVIDQFEEFFRPGMDRERERFFTLLPPALGSTIQLVGTLRSESADQVTSDPSISRYATFDYIRPLGTEALRRVIREPAARAGMELENGLADLLLDDTGSGTALPLLAFTLASLADEARPDQRSYRGGVLSVRRYRELGGVQGTLTRAADTALAEAAAVRQEGTTRSRAECEHAVITALLQLAGVDPDGRTSRRRVARAELAEATVADFAPFVRKRLLVTSQEAPGGPVFFDVAHERLLTEWKPLADAITRTAGALRSRDEVHVAAGVWADAAPGAGSGWRARLSNPPRRALWDDNRVGAALVALDARVRPEGPLRRPRSIAVDRVQLDDRSRAFLLASYRRYRSRRRRWYVVLSALLVVATVGALVASFLAATISRQRDEALSRSVAARAELLDGSDPALSRLLDVAAYQISPTAEATSGLLSRAFLPQVTRELDFTGSSFASAVSPRRRLLATGGAAGGVHLWTLDDPTRPARAATLPTGSAAVSAIALSADGTQLAAGDYDGTVSLWSVRDPANPVVVLPPRTPAIGRISAVALSPDGRTLAVAGADDPRIVLLNITVPGAPTRWRPQLDGNLGGVNALAFSPDSQILASGGSDATLRLWNVADPANPVARPPQNAHANGVAALAFSPDGRTLVTGGADFVARLWQVADLSGPNAAARALSGHTSRIFGVGFSTDGSRVATTGNDQTVRVWDTATAAAVAVLPHHQPTQSVAFLDGGTELASTANDGVLRVWHLAGPRLTAGTGGVLSAVSPNGRLVAAGGEDGAVRMWDVADPDHPAPLGEPFAKIDADVQRMTFSPDSRLLAVPRGNGTVQLWNVAEPARPALLGSFPASSGSVTAVAFDPRNASIVATSGTRGEIRIWDIGDPTRPVAAGAAPDRSGAVFDLAFNADGTVLAAGGGDERTQLYDVTALPAVVPVGSPLAGHTGYVQAVAFAPDGATLATAGADGQVLLWDVTTRTSPAGPTVLHNDGGPALDVAFDAAGQLAMANGDGSTWLWDLHGGPPTVVARLTGPRGPVYSVDYDPGRPAVVTGDADGHVVVWRTDTAAVVETICRTAGAALTSAEWAQYVPGGRAEPACG